MDNQDLLAPCEHCGGDALASTPVRVTPDEAATYEHDVVQDEHGHQVIYVDCCGTLQ